MLEEGFGKTVADPTAAARDENVLVCELAGLLLGVGHGDSLLII